MRTGKSKLMARIVNYRRILLQLGLAIVVLFAAFDNMMLRAELFKRTATLRSSVNESAFISAVDSIKAATEGKFLLNFPLTDQDGREVNLFSLISGDSPSIVVMEPPVACTSCLTQTLSTFTNQVKVDSRVSRIRLIIVSTGASRNAVALAEKFGMDSLTYRDMSGNIYSHLKLPYSLPIAFLLEPNGLIVYAQPLHWDYPQYFLDFLNRSCSYIQGEPKPKG
jgi:peroxiredoxin